MGTACQFAGVPVTVGQAEGFKYLHDLLTRLQLLLPVDGYGLATASRTGGSARQVDPGGQWVSTRAGQLSATGQFCWPPAGRFMASTGHFLMAADSDRSN